jgi:hypothetical protein
MMVTMDRRITQRIRAGTASPELVATLPACHVVTAHVLLDRNMALWTVFRILQNPIHARGVFVDFNLPVLVATTRDRDYENAEADQWKDTTKLCLKIQGNSLPCTSLPHEKQNSVSQMHLAGTHEPFPTPNLLRTAIAQPGRGHHLSQLMIAKTTKEGMDGRRESQNRPRHFAGT